jgi:DNA-binding transcriptional LysR family regulator
VDLLQLRSFQAVARHEHVTRAAEQLHVSQPALSRTLGRLERELGVALFDRDGRRLRLNRFGQMFLHRVDRVLGELEGASRELVESAGLERGVVAVASETLRTVSDLLAQFLRANPDVRLRLYQSTAERMLDQLQAAEVDLCFASQPLEGTLLTSVALIDEEVLLAVPVTHRLAGRDRARIAELEGEPFITTRHGYWLRALAERLFSAAGVEPNFACESDEPAAIRGLISDGLGIGLLPAIARETAAEPAVAWLGLRAAGCRRTLRLVWRRDAYLSIAAQHFRATTIDHFNAVPSGHAGGHAG